MQAFSAGGWLISTSSQPSTFKTDSRWQRKTRDTARHRHTYIARHKQRFADGNNSTITNTSKRSRHDSYGASASHLSSAGSSLGRLGLFERLRLLLRVTSRDSLLRLVLALRALHSATRKTCAYHKTGSAIGDRNSLILGGNSCKRPRAAETRRCCFYHGRGSAR